jgi:hypothetical protein
MLCNRTYRLKHTSSIASCCFKGILFASVTLAVCAASSEETGEAEATAISVGRMVFCRSIEEREPHGAADVFPEDVGRIYCFTVVLNAGAEGTHVVHKWYFQDKLMAEVKLKARGEYWRTWSVKNVTPEWKGPWRVDVVSATGEVLKSRSFVLGESEPGDSSDEASGSVEMLSDGNTESGGGSDENGSKESGEGVVSEGGGDS